MVWQNYGQSHWDWTQVALVIETFTESFMYLPIIIWVLHRSSSMVIKIELSSKVVATKN